jgi:linker histone H1 and H5 family
VKISLWPTDLAAAVTELQSPHPSASQRTQKDLASGPVINATPSISSYSEATAQSSPTGALVTNATNETDSPSDNTNNHRRANTDEPSVPQEPRTDTAQPTPQPILSTSSAAPAATASSQGPYPHASYGYPLTQSLQAYPHTPYYPPLTYPHNFAPQPSVPYPHAAFPPPHSPFPPTHASNSPFPIPHSGALADDLPSYEDMLVEALTELNEPDGSVPKSLFTWMASRYPLHTNFRPSASQALQKAFKRGRLEKGSNGKYRLNASWDGGSVGSVALGSVSRFADAFCSQTSRRTTRRPQTMGQTAFPASNGTPTTSPFTHAPLSHPTRNGLPCTSSADTAQGKPPLYHPYPFQYPPAPAYLGYGPPAPPPVSKGDSSAEQRPAAAVSDVSTQAASGENNTINEDVGEGSDAWEAAQAILKAINFGSFLQVAAPKPAVSSFGQLPIPASSATIGAASDRSLAAAPHANNKMPQIGAATSPVHVLSDRDRASLQAQLALLAAQLAEIAEDTLASDLNDAEEGIDTAGEEGG